MDGASTYEDPLITRLAASSQRSQRAMFALIGLLLFANWITCSADAIASREYPLKAAFLYNFTKFIEWPPGCFSDANQPIVIGVLGQTPMEGELERLTHGRLVNGRVILVKRVETPEAARAAHLLFVSADAGADFATLAAAIESSPVVTVSESHLPPTTQAVINFVLAEDKVRFEINMIAADRAGLKISAQLQKLAILVRKNT